MGYASVECELTEKETRGQNQNKNWHSMRAGLITASNVKKVMCSTNEDKTAEVLSTGSSLNEENLPASIQFGRTHETTALRLFRRAHRYQHINCKLTQTGRIVSETLSFLGASPDGIVSCTHKNCGRFLAEVKCLFALRYDHPKHALKQCTFTEQSEDGH